MAHSVVQGTVGMVCKRHVAMKMKCCPTELSHGG